MGCARRRYQPRHAEASALHEVIRKHLDNFLRAAADRADEAGLPKFITREFREFLLWGSRGRLPCCSLMVPWKVPTL